VETVAAGGPRPAAEPAARQPEAPSPARGFLGKLLALFGKK